MKTVGLFVCVLILWALPAAAITVVPLPQGGTVTFCETRPQGTYINGDPWILGPVTICEKSVDVALALPTQSGCMVNPVPAPQVAGVDGVEDSFDNGYTQGFDSRMTGGNPYSGALNYCDSFPSASIAATSSIVFGRSLATPSQYANSTAMRFLAAWDVVTVEDSDPGGNAFRPPFAGAAKPNYTRSGLRYDVLQDLALVTGQKTIAQILATNYFRGPNVSLSTGVAAWEDANATSGWNSPVRPYSRAINNVIGEMIGGLNQNASDATKEPLAIRVVQQAIDAYGQFLNGRTWTAPGGFCTHIEMFGLVGASLLNNQDMMDAFSSTLHPWDYCASSRWHYITMTDVNTQRASYCGSNSQSDTSNCVAFSPAMLGRPEQCEDLWIPNYHAHECSAFLYTTYMWLNSGSVAVAVYMRLMGLEEELGAPAMISYFYGTVLPGATNWGDGRYVQYNITNSFNNSCAAGNGYDANGIMQWACNLWLTHRNAKPTNGSITGGSVPNEPPSISLTSPSAAVTVVQTGATIALGGTTTDPDGTVSSVPFTASCDASVTTSGTSAAWTRTVDLPLNTVCTISGHAVDDDGASSPDLVVSVLRVSNDCTSLADPFSLSGVWPTPNLYCWGRMVGDLVWENNHLRSASTSRHLFIYNQAVNNDQMTTVTVDSLPDSGTWVYAGVRGSVSGANYNGVGCTAQNPVSYIATFVNTVRAPIQTIDMTATPWVVGDRLSCRVIGQQYCLLKNDVVQGSCVTDGSTTFTGGLGWAGAWGVSGAFDNFTVTAQAGGDIIAPVLSIVTPASGVQVAATPYTSLAGTASDAVGVVSCVWSVPENPAVGGACSGTTTWSVPSIALLAGTNTVQVTVADAAGLTATSSRVIDYVPASSVTATFTYPNAAATWGQAGTLVDLAGTMTAMECASVLLTNVSHPDPTIAGSIVVATGTDAWLARVRLIVGENNVRIGCMTGADGTGTSKLTVTKTVTATRLAVRR